MWESLHCLVLGSIYSLKVAQFLTIRFNTIKFNSNPCGHYTNKRPCHERLFGMVEWFWKKHHKNILVKSDFIMHRRYFFSVSFENMVQLKHNLKIKQKQILLCETNAHGPKLLP